MVNYKFLVLALFATLFLGSCSEDQLLEDEAKIQEYLTDNNLTAEKSEDGVYYIITREGNGKSATVDSEVTVHYKGYRLNGDVFDSSYDRGQKSTFGLQRVIRGWQLGIPLLEEEGAGTLIIPSHLAYGANPPSGSIIRRNDVLVFDIELFEVNP
jgi:FKBP-type peptidyl-prolyl cis-trans isomerase FkpA